MKQKRWLLLVILAALILGSWQNLAFAQNKLFSEPKRLLLKGDKINEDFESPTLIKEIFYPIGWSKDGKFAYYLEPADEACGCYFAEIRIIDLKTDKVLWTKQYESEEGKADNIKTYWRKSRKEFSQKLNQYGIQVPQNFPLAKPLIKNGKDAIKVDLFSDVSLQDDPYNSKGTTVIKLISPQKGEKTVYQKIYSGENYEGVMSADLGGILQSPFENRVAIILVNTVRGWEGPPHITRISVIGADLRKRFK